MLIEPFGRLAAADEAALAGEGAALLRFVAGQGTPGDVRIQPPAG